jgi:DNA-binding response OmpR family regulator
MMQTAIGQASILMVEDDPFVGRVIARFLDREGFTIDIASSAEDVFYRLNLKHYDLVLTDLHLPGMSGAELVDQLRRDAPDLPVILMTGDPDEAIELLASQAGTTALLRKPFANSELLACVSAALA